MNAIIIIRWSLFDSLDEFKPIVWSGSTGGCRSTAREYTYIPIYLYSNDYGNALFHLRPTPIFNYYYFIIFISNFYSPFGTFSASTNILDLTLSSICVHCVASWHRPDFSSSWLPIIVRVDLWAFFILVFRWTFCRLYHILEINTHYNILLFYNTQMGVFLNIAGTLLGYLIIALKILRK